MKRAPSRVLRTFLFLVPILFTAILITGTSTITAQEERQPQIQASAPPAGLFLPVDVSVSADAHPAHLRSRAATLNDTLLQKAFAPLDVGDSVRRLPLTLFDDVSVTAELDRLNLNQSGSTSWIGHLHGVPDSQVLFVTQEGVLVGVVMSRDRVIEISYMGGGVHRVTELDQSQFVDHPPNWYAVATAYSAESLSRALPPTYAPSAADDGSVIDILVGYTDDARVGAGGTTAIELTAQLAVDATNITYANSGVTQRLFLVHTEEFNYAESGDSATDLARWRGTSDGHMDGVHTSRNTYHADLSVLLTENGGGFCGFAYLQTGISVGFESYAFGVVARNCAVGNLSFAHEVGHNLGLRHDWYADSGVTPFSYAHGFTNPPDSWRTVMAYNSHCIAVGGSCTRLPYHSNPSVSLGGDPMGVEGGTFAACAVGNLSPDPNTCDADSERVINHGDTIYAQWRSSQNTWLGYSSDWTDPANWEINLGSPFSLVATNRVPLSVDDVVIPSSPVGGNFPSVGSSTAVRDVLIETGASLTLTGGTLTVYGDWEEQGTGQFTASGGDVVFAGSLDTTVTASADSTFPNVTFGDGSTQSVTLNSDLDIDGDVTYAAGTSLSAGSNTMEVAGDWVDQGGGFSADSSTVSFDGSLQSVSKTPSSLIFSEDFDDEGNGNCANNLPAGWSQEVISVGFGWATGEHTECFNNGPTSTPYAVRWWDTPEAWLFTHGQTLGADKTYELEFKYANDNGSISNFDVYVAPSADSTSMLAGTNIVNTSTSSTSYQTATGSFTIASTGTYYLGIRAYRTSGSNYGFVDDVILRDITPQSLNNATVGNGSTVTFQNDVTFQGDLIANSGGTIDFSTSVVAVEGTVTNSGALKQTASPTNGNATQFLNIKDAAGTTDKYWGVSITPTTGDMGSTTVTVYGGQDCITAGLADGQVLSDGIQRCYDIAPTTPQTAEITFYYRSAEANGNDTPHAFHYLGSADNWEGEVFSARDTGSAEASYVTATSIDNYSPFAIGNAINFVTTIIDVTPGTATNDGTIGGTEYVGHSTGINSGFGNIIGSNSKLHFDSDSSGNLNIGIEAGGAIVSPNAAVIYIDIDDGATGFSDTSGFTDTADNCRRGISGWDGTNRSRINFAAGFAANYAICIDGSFAGLWQLVNGGSHTYITSVNRTTVAANHYELDLTLANLGLSAGDDFNYIATYLNENNAFRSDEFHGVAAYAGGNPGYTTVTLGAGAYNRFVSVPSFANLDGGTGPGGIGENDGTSALELWLKADAGTSTTSDGVGVSTWADQSGNGHGAVQATGANQPTFEENELNGNPTVRFDGTNDYFDLPAGVIQGVSNFTFFGVIDWHGGGVWQRIWDFGDGSTDKYGFLTPSAGVTNRPRFAIKKSNTSGENILNWGTALPTNSGQLLGMRWPASGTAQGYLNGANSGSVAVASTPADLGPISHNFIGRSIFSPDPYLNSDMAEFIVFTAALNSAERIIVENYLSAKYNIAVTNDRYAGDTNANGDFDFNVAGIGQEADGTHSLSHGGGMIVRDVSFLNDNGDYLLFGRQTTDCSPVLTEYPAEWDGEPNPGNWGCSWYIDITDAAGTTGGTVDIVFDYSEAGVVGMPEEPVSNYGLLKRSAATGQYDSDITDDCVGGAVYLSGDRVIFTQVDTSPACLGSNFTLGSKDSDIPVAVTLAAFDAQAQPDGSVRIVWETGAEIDHAGFNVYRSAVPVFDAVTAVQLNAELITAQAQLGTGATYTWVDDTAPPGSWYYFLEDVDLTGIATLHGPVSADTFTPTSTALVTLDGDATLTSVLLLGMVAVLTGAALLPLRRRQID